MLRSLLILTIVLSCAAYAADPVATVTTGGFLKVNGNVIPTKGAPTWPLFAGDEVITEPDAAVVTIPEDGSRFALGPLTHIVIKSCTREVIQMHSGSTTWDASKDPKIQICALGHPIDPKPLTQGTVTIDEHAKKVFVITPKHGQVEVAKGECACGAGIPWLAAHETAIILATGAVAALATGIAVSLPSARSASAP
jgi:hypothetical protein